MMTKAIGDAIELLRNKNLVWSADIEDIKGDIVALLFASAAQGDIIQTLADNLARKIISGHSTENVTVYDLQLEKRDDA
jgi:hypothetical protein